jgi:hypothetical protein
MKEQYKTAIGNFDTIELSEPGYQWWQPQYTIADYKITIIEEYEKGELIKKTEIREPIYRQEEEK